MSNNHQAKKISLDFCGSIVWFMTLSHNNVRVFVRKRSCTPMITVITAEED